MLKDLILSITNRCNLRCRMCDIPLAETEEVETRVWERVIQEAAGLGANTVVFSGGEPLLREDL
ncbi:MAG: radical SAM protein, partial [Candidatus Omnitrophota bacterium]